MSKKSRGFQPERSAPATPSTDEAAAATRSTETARSGRSPRRAARRTERGSARTARGGILERYRGLLIGGVVVAAVGLIGIFLFQGASAAPYTCDSLLTPPPGGTAPGAAPVSPAPAGPLAPDDEDAALGFATEDLGRSHQPTGRTIRYAFCPPTSGDHWSGSRSPLRRDVYSPGDAVSPGNWVHNLEHGYVVFAYRGEIGSAVLSEIRRAVEEAPPGETAEACGLPNKVIAVRFDDMAEPFAALAWDRALLMPEWDSDAAKRFADAWQDSPQAPERVC